MLGDRERWLPPPDCLASWRDLFLWLQSLTSGAEQRGQFQHLILIPFHGKQREAKSGQQFTFLWRKWKLASLSIPNSGGAILKTLPKHMTTRANLKERERRKEGRKEREREARMPWMLIVNKWAGHSCLARGQLGMIRIPWGPLPELKMLKPLWPGGGPKFHSNVHISGQESTYTSLYIAVFHHPMARKGPEDHQRPREEK